jgi:subtilisin-like proprotein convertase family protein
MNRSRFGLLIAVLVIASSGANAQKYWNTAAGLGSTAYIAVRDDDVLDLQDSFTIECWVKLEDIGGTLQCLLAKRRTVVSTGYRLGFIDGVLSWSGGGTSLSSSSRVPYNVWTYVAVTYSASTHIMTMYINGTADTSATFPTNWAPTPNTDSLYIGYYPTTGMYAGSHLPLRGQIDDLRIWSRALSAYQISQYWRMTLSSGTGYAYSGLEFAVAFDWNWGGSPSVLYCSDWSGSERLPRAHRGEPVTAIGEQPFRTADQMALDLDGGGDYIAGPSTEYVRPSGSFTLECWIHPRGVQTQATIIQKGKGTAWVDYALTLDHGRPALRTRGFEALVAPTALEAGVWSHVAAVFDSSKTLSSIYINGVLDTAHVDNTPPGSSTDSLFVGDGAAGGFNGYIDEVRICRFAMTTAQVRSTRWCSMDRANMPDDAGTTVSYNFDGFLVDNASYSGPTCRFNGHAHFTTSWLTAGIPQAPMLRADELGFPSQFATTASDRRIPATSTIGWMTPDSLQIRGMGFTVTDIELFVALDHPQPEALTITLVSPGKDSLVVFSEHNLAGNACNVITIFDDDANVSLSSSRTHLGFGPTVRPQQSLRGRFVGKQGVGQWKLLIKDGLPDGTGRLYAWGLRLNSNATSVAGPSEESPGEFQLAQNYPNPFNPSTAIPVFVPARQRVVIGIYDLLGREVALLMDEEKDAGSYTVRWDASRYASGLYICRATAGPVSLCRKVLLMK